MLKTTLAKILIKLLVFFHTQSFAYVQKILIVLQQKAKLLEKIIHWRIFGQKQYYDISLLCDPIEKIESSENYNLLKTYYENGFVVIDGDTFEGEGETIILDIKEHFSEMIQWYDSLTAESKTIFLWDKRGIRWKLNKAKGLLQMMIPNPNHPKFSKLKSGFEDHTSPYTLQEFLQEFPIFQKVIYHSSLLQLANYANFGDSEPTSIILERKLHGVDSDLDEFQPHVDHTMVVFKSFLYLNEVNDANGPLHLREGTHHWKKNPKLLEIIKTDNIRRFHVNGTLDKLKLPPCKVVQGKAGTQVAFSTNAVHHASNPEPGYERWSMQIYFYTFEPWSTDKK